jgi:hypothetical protein
MRILFFTGILFFLLSAISCRNVPTKMGEHRGFYYWKTNFRLSDSLSQKLQELEVGHLYIKHFDVTWDEQGKKAVPVALLNVIDSFPGQVRVTPVVFLTLEALKNTEVDKIPALAVKMGDLLQKLTGRYANDLSDEIQIDCDWTEQTKDAYFTLLKELKKHSFFQSRTLSVTIRLHQVKYINEAGIPPADRGLLMCYNMGNLRDPSAKNSIIDPATFKSYTGRLNDYPLPLDIALPLFDWWVWFRNQQYYGLVHAANLPADFADGRKTNFRVDTLINGYQFSSGDWLRHENSPVSSLVKISASLPLRFRSGKSKLILYHLDSASLSKYSIHELEDIYRRFD